MLNRNEKLEIAKRLRLSTESEMSRYDLEQMLEAELNKPEDEMDTELVQQILEILEDGPSMEQQHKSWQQIDKRLKFKQWQPVVSGLTRIAAVGVILVALLFATYGTAQALNWEFLLRWMKPFAETFMIYSGDDPVTTSEPKVNEVYSDDRLSFTQMEFTTLADCPDQIDGYPAKPVWMPERFAYLQGSMYADTLITSITHVYQSDMGRCIIDISLLDDANDVDSYSYEQTENQPTHSEYVQDYSVTFYYNNEGQLTSASWIVNNAHYSITGRMTKDEILQILTSILP